MSKSNKGMKATSHIHLVPQSRVHGASPPQSHASIIDKVLKHYILGNIEVTFLYSYMNIPYDETKILLVIYISGNSLNLFPK